MSQQYSSRIIYSTEDEKEISVTSEKCSYWIWINEDEVTLRGPGVREVGGFPEITGKLDDEDFAIFIVLLFENGLWPEE